MKDFFRGKIATVIILLATFVLAGVAIFTAIRLYQLRSTSVAPNAPVSFPKADSGGIPTESSGSATPTATPHLTAQPIPSSGGAAVTATGSGAISLNDNPASQNCGGAANAQCIGTLVCIYSNGSTTPPTTGATGICGQPSATATPTATATATASSSATVKPTATATAAPTQAPNQNSCSMSFTLNLATTTPTATPTNGPTNTPTATPTSTPVPNCNNTCTQNSDCPSNLICFIASGATTGSCRNTSCTDQVSCICATATPTATAIAQGPTAPPAQPTLPQSGTDWPTTLGIGIGILTIVGSLILAI